MSAKEQPQDANRDPITGEPRSHPVGTGVGAITGGAAAGGLAGIFIPLRREEAVIERSVRPSEEVKASKRRETEQQNVREDVRRDDVEIEREHEAGAGSGRN